MFNSKIKTMVTVTDYDKRLSGDGREFFTLTIQGGVEVVTSQNGNMYMTSRKTSIPSTFDEAGCKMLIGNEIPGNIEKVPCDTYEYVNQGTGEIISLSHTCEYVAEKKETPKLMDIPEFLPYGMNENVPVTAP